MVRELLKKAAEELSASDSPMLDAGVLLASVMNKSNAALIFDMPTEEEMKLFREYIEKRKQGVPVAYILGEKEFMGLNFKLNSDTLIPRPDTECLVEKIIEENTVGPTLGADSIAKSKMAGALGLGFVMLFMVAYYRAPGMIANIALIIYGLILFALFKAIPVTLTLAGIAGFILSIGMAVDANILIFERTKEELKAGRTLFTAINSGFDRAWTSIFDSNMTTIITCAILYCCGTSIVKGFALTLALGVIVSMFSAITITKNFMHLIFGTGNLKNPALFGLKADEIGEGYSVVETKREKAKFGILD